MTTQSWSAILQHSTDAQFRAWGSDFAAKLSAIGLVQTSDTGQINWTTVTRPAVNTAGGYEIWRFNDSLQGTSPIYLKIEYGTAAVATYPQIWLTVGTGSNGSGTLTGTTSTRTTCATTNAAGGLYDTASSWPSYFCCVTGFVGCVFRQGVSTHPAPAFMVARFCDADGTPNGNGFVVYAGPTAINLPSRVQSVRTAATANAFTIDVSGLYCLIPHGITVSTTSTGDMQVFSHWAPTNLAAQVFACNSYFATELSQGSTFTTTLMGASPRTFIGTGHNLGTGGVGATGSRIAMLWE